VPGKNPLRTDAYRDTGSLCPATAIDHFLFSSLCRASEEEGEFRELEEAISAFGSAGKALDRSSEANRRLSMSGSGPIAATLR